MRSVVATALLLLVVLVAGCGGSGGTATPATVSAPQTIRVSSAAFADGATLPARFTCAGAGESPPLRWTGVPAKARSLALLVDDPDAPGGDFVHWLVVDIPPRTGSVAAGAAPDGQLPGHVLAGSAGDRSWTPPCPPDGTHHYRFTLYALDGVATTTDRDEVIAGLDDHAVAWGRLTGLVRH
jgi:Raf kinase inhibitor-like YbhB/YbcL family protein